MDFLRSGIKGWVGELKTKLSQTIFLDSKEYRRFDNFIIEDERGSTQIDHIIVSRYGIFVIETKDKGGWIFGNEKSATWTQTFPTGDRFKFQNPLHQNYRHTKSLSQYLDVNHEKLESLVIFWGGSKFKTKMPDNVIHGGFEGGANYIKRFTDILFTDDEINNICEKLKAGKAEMGFLSGWKHTQSLKKRLENTCPKCGKQLLERTGVRGKFLGCEGFPKCRYTEDID